MFRKSLFAIGVACLAFTAGPAWAAINAADYGVSESNGDNSEALQRAINAGKASGEEVIIPNGNLKYGKQLHINGVKVRGSGSTTLVATNTMDQSISLTGNAPALRNLRIAYKHEHRGKKSPTDGHAGVKVRDANGFVLEGLHLDGAAQDGKTANGGGPGGGGIFIRKSTNGVVQNNRINDTMADCIHITTGSRNIKALSNRIDRCGDDGVAAIGSVDGVLMQGNVITNNRHGRGLTAVGSKNIQILNNTVDGNQENGAGIYVASEANYRTGAPENVTIRGNTVQNTGGPGKGHGQIMIWNGGGPPSNIEVTKNNVRNSETPNHAIVVSGSMGPNVRVYDNNVDGDVTSRNGGRFGGENRENDPGMKNPINIPGVTPAPGVDGGGGPFTPPPPPLSAKKIEADIAALRARGLSNAAIKYLFALDGIRIPPDVLAGKKTVADAIKDGSLERASVPGNVAPPPVPPTPEPDLTPQGSSGLAGNPASRSRPFKASGARL